MSTNFGEKYDAREKGEKGKKGRKGGEKEREKSMRGRIMTESAT